MLRGHLRPEAIRVSTFSGGESDRRLFHSSNSFPELIWAAKVNVAQNKTNKNSGQMNCFLSVVYLGAENIQAPCTLDATRDATRKNGARSHFDACCFMRCLLPAV